MIFFKKKVKKTLRLHEELGFPAFSKEDQIQMLLSQNFQPINDLVKSKVLPNEVLYKYITINEMDFCSQVQIQNLIDVFDKKNELRNNGISLLKSNDNYRVIWKDRGEVMNGWKFGNDHEVIDFFSKLLLSTVPKYQHLSPL